MTETIVSAAIRYGESNETPVFLSALPPARHHTLFYAARLFGIISIVSTEDQGFLTSTGRFVCREEALQIALAAKQTEAPKYQPTQLFSEDLW